MSDNFSTASPKTSPSRIGKGHSTEILLPLDEVSFALVLRLQSGISYP